MGAFVVISRTKNTGGAWVTGSHDDWSTCPYVTSRKTRLPTRGTARVWFRDIRTLVLYDGSHLSSSAEPEHRRALPLATITIVGVVVLILPYPTSRSRRLTPRWPWCWVRARARGRYGLCYSSLTICRSRRPLLRKACGMIDCWG